MEVVLAVLAVIGLIVALLVILIAGFIYFARRTHRKGLGQQALELDEYPQWAAERGLSYSERDDSYLDSVSGHMPFSNFDQARGNYAQGWHVFSGSVNGREMALFQLTVAVAPDAPPSGMLTVAVARLAEPSPDILITPKSRIDRINGPAGQRPIMNDGRPTAYAVYSPSAPDTHPVLTKPQVAWLSAVQTKDRPSFHLNGDWATCYRGGPITLDRGRLVSDALNDFLDADDAPSS